MLVTGCWLPAERPKGLPYYDYFATEIIAFMSYKNLDVWRLARELTIEVHKMTLELPAF